MTFTTLPRLFTVMASTKRAPAITGGKRGAAVTNLANIKCSPLYPVDENVRRRYSTETAIELRQSFCALGLDIREGDLLVIGSKEYPVRSVGDWPGAGPNYLHLIVEEQKTP